MSKEKEENKKKRKRKRDGLRAGGREGVNKKGSAELTNSKTPLETKKGV